MLEVLISSGPIDSPGSTHLYLLRLYNDETGDAEVGNYVVELWSVMPTFGPKSMLHTGRIEGHERGGGPLPLVQRALESLPERLL